MPQSAPILFLKGVAAKYAAWAAANATAASFLKAGVQLALSAALTSVMAPDVPAQGAQTNLRQPLPPRRQGVGTFRAQGAVGWIGAKGNTLDRVILWPENDGAPVEVLRTWLTDDLVTIETNPLTGKLSVKPFPDGRYGAKLFGSIVLPLITLERRVGLMASSAYSALHEANPAYPANARNDGTPTSWYSVSHGKLDQLGTQLPGREGEPNEERSYAAYDWRYDSTAVLRPATDAAPAVMGDGPQRRDDPSTWGRTNNVVVWGVNVLWRTYGADWEQCFAPILGDLAEEADVCDETVSRVYGTGTLTEDAEAGAEVLKLSNTEGLADGSVLVVGTFELEVLGFDGGDVVVAPLEAGFAAGTAFSWEVATGADVSEKRYEIGFEFSKGTPPGEIIQHHINAMAGWFGVTRQGGYMFRAGREKTPTVIFGDAEILDITFDPGPTPDQVVNVLTTSFSDPDAAYTMVESRQWRDAASIAAEGKERPAPFAPTGVHSSGQLARLAAIAGQRGLLPRGTFRTPLSSRRGFGHDVVGLRCSVLEDLYNVSVDVLRTRTDLRTATIEWSFRFRPDFGWNPAEQEPPPPTVPPIDAPQAATPPTIDSVEVFFDDGGLPRLRVFALGPDPERIDITWKLGIALATDTAFNVVDVEDLDPDTPVKLESGIVPQGPLKVIVGYQVGGGVVVWMDAADAEAVSTLVGPAAPTEVTADADGANVDVSWRNPGSSNLHHLIVLRGATNVIGDAEEISSELSPTGLLAEQTFTDTAPLVGDSYYWVVAYTAADIASPPGGPAMVTFGEAETFTILAAFTTPATDARKVLINNLVRELKTAGVWAILDALYILAAHDSQAARINWINPTGPALNPINSPTFTVDRGYQGDGASQYIPFGYGLSSLTKGSPNSLMVGTWDQQAGGAGYSLGLSGGFPVSLRLDNGNGVTAGGHINDSTAITFSTATAVGLTVLNRSGASSREVYRDGVQQGSDTQASSGAFPAANFWLLRDSSTGGGFSTRRLSAALVGASADATAQANTYSALTAYMTAVGAA